MSETDLIHQTAAALGQAIPDPMMTELLQGYRTGDRHYHDLSHIAEVLGWLERVQAGPGWHAPREVLMAALFHDIVYDPLRSDNEARSADIARASIQRHLGGAGLDAQRVVMLIEETARHGAHSQTLDADACHFLDADMAILGAPPARFQAYDRQIRDEYAVVPEALYGPGRRAFFERLLTSERIFLSEWFHQRLEGPARDNLRSALSA